ncbi:hypothetical protein PR202_ga03879 [Eleusine coracana subsp. coracana]|uniref:RING-type domain-containing protein n=1 Tax=Eleusine coracana subsp. coracana TaxID=191504 RepID=A0AAV5BPI4_ELECO|nr:hypothetical protein PR202_ga03879 [Eleusine coracana subsp. coracana]
MMMLGISHPTGRKLLNMIDHVLSVRKEFEQCEISLVEPSQVSYVTQLARDSIDAQIAKALAAESFKEKRETCTICLEDNDVSKIHVIEGCAHRFCFSCMKEHVKAKIFHGMLPACPQDGCTTKLTVEGSKIFLSPRLLEIMVQRVREGQIPPSQKIYCPYPKCSALMSLSEVIHPMQASSSKYTVADVDTLRNFDDDDNVLIREVVADGCQPSGALRPSKSHSCEDSCKAGRSYPTYTCSPPTTSGGSGATKAIMTLNDFDAGGEPSECDGKFHRNTERVVALSTGWYDGGSRCGKNVRIRANGKSVLAKVVDECDMLHGFQPPCRPNVVDTSQAVWDKLGITGDDVGEYDITWSDA